MSEILFFFAKTEKKLKTGFSMIWDPNTAPIDPKPIFSESLKKCRDYQKKNLENIFGKVVFGHPTFEILVCKSELYRFRRGVSPYSAVPESKNLKSAKYGQGVIFFENFLFALSDLGTSNKAPESFLGRFGTGKSSKNRLYRLFIFLPPSNPMAFEKA